MGEFKVGNSSKGFTGVRVFNKETAAVFNGTSPTQSFLYMILTDAKGKM